MSVEVKQRTAGEVSPFSRHLFKKWAMRTPADKSAGRIFDPAWVSDALAA
jgi:hypothetical protein